MTHGYSLTDICLHKILPLERVSGVLKPVFVYLFRAIIHSEQWHAVSKV